MMLISTFLLALATGVAAAHKCENITVPLELTSRNAVFNVTAPETDVDVTNLMLDFTRVGQNFTKSVTLGYRTIRKNYTIAATFCETGEQGRDVLQILTHGVGFDRSYWDLPYDNYKYSYVKRALDRGYSVLYWDRLGIAQSSHGNPINEIQIFLEIAALKGLTRWVKDGKLHSGRHKKSKIVHVGHSFGSAITHGMAREDPKLSNAIILTGFSQVSSYLGEFALGANFASVKSIKALADKYSAGYVATKSTIGVQTNFFAPHDFDPRVLKLAQMTGQPAALGELLTLGSVPAQSDFKGPVLIVTGERDVPFCGGDCTKTGSAINGSAPDLLRYSKKNFRETSAFRTAMIPGAGHGLNYQYSAPRTYKAITDFLSTHV